MTWPRAPFSKVYSDRPCHAVVFYNSADQSAGSVIPVTTPAIYTIRTERLGTFVRIVDVLAVMV